MEEDEVDNHLDESSSPHWPESRPQGLLNLEDCNVLILRKKSFENFFDLHISFSFIIIRAAQKKGKKLCLDFFIFLIEFEAHKSEII